MLDHVSVVLMKNRALKADFGPSLNRASLLSALRFAVIAVAFPVPRLSFPVIE